MHDNPVLHWAAKYGSKNKEVLPVYSFDPRFMNTKVDKFGTVKCGINRARFLIESVVNLRSKLESIGSNLLVTQEKPEDFLPKLLRHDADNALVYQQEICKEEVDVEYAVEDSLKLICKNLEI